MPKQIYQLKDFSGGLNTLQDAADIRENQLSGAKNIMFNLQGSIQPAYSMTDATNNKLTTGTYSNTHIASTDAGESIQSGHGLGYFETDYVRDPVIVTQTSSITGDDDNEGSATGFIARSAFKELEYKVSGTIQNLISSFPVGTDILLTSTTRDADGFDPAGQGIYTVVGVGSTNAYNLLLDRAIPISIETPPQNFWGATISGFPSGDKVILLANPKEHKIDTFSFNTAGTGWESDSVILRTSETGIDSKIRYYKVDDAIRCSDTADKNDCQIKWYVFINRRHFDGAAASTDANTYLDYYSKDNDLAIPTNGDCVDGGTTPAVSTYPTAGNGFDFNISNNTGVDGLIPAGSYEFAQTFIYDNNQESLPNKYSTVVTVDDTDDLKVFSVNIGTTGPFDPRISGGRIYIREQNVDTEWSFLVDINLTKGCRTRLTDTYTSWSDAGSSTYSCPTTSAGGNFIIKEMSFLTYETINGYPSSIFSNALGDAGEYWKDSVVTNNRAFICNITMKDENQGATKAESTTKSFPDRIMYSMPNRYDTFPYFNFIEAAKGDADGYVAIDSFADRILAFKTYSMDIINISSPSDSNWFLEDSKKYMGIEHPELVKRTQYGLVWANKQGLYLYDGNSIRNLSENSISDSTWAAHVDYLSTIIYDEQESMIFVIKNSNSDGDAYMCDLKKGTFTFIDDFVLVSNDGITNSVDTEDNNTYIAHDEGDTVDFYKLHRTPAKHSDVEIITKNIDFGDPNISKKVYAIYMTYKSDTLSIADKVYYSTDGGTNWVVTSGPTSVGTTTWLKGKWVIATPPTTSKVMIKIDTGSNSAVYINDIGIEYRPVHKRMA